MIAHGLLGDLRAYEVSGCSLAGRQEVVVGLCFSFEDVEFEVFPEGRVGQRDFSDLLALREDRQATALVVEVLELDGPQSALPQPVVE